MLSAKNTIILLDKEGGAIGLIKNNRNALRLQSSMELWRNIIGVLERLQLSTGPDNYKQN